MTRHYFLTILFISLFGCILANTFKAPTITDTLFIGQVINIELDLTKWQPERIHMIQDRRARQVEIFEIIEQTSKPWHYLLRVAPFDTGYIHLERLPIMLFSKGEIDTVYVEPFGFRVRSALTAYDIEIRDIAPPRPFKLKFVDYAFPTLILLIIVAIIYFLLRLKRKKDMTTEFVDDRPAWMIALQLLSEFKQKGYLLMGEYLEFYYELSLIFRIFLELQFKIKAAEMTTWEIKQNLSDIEHKAKIISILTNMDMVKFAKGIPDLNDAEEMLAWIESYIYSFAKEESDV